MFISGYANTENVFYCLNCNKKAASARIVKLSIFFVNNELCVTISLCLVFHCIVGKCIIVTVIKTIIMISIYQISGAIFARFDWLP